MAVFGIGTRYSFGIFLKSLEVDFSAGRGTMSSIFSVYMLLGCFVSILGGWAMDRYGPKKVGLLMGAFTGLSLLMTGMARDIWQLYLTYSVLLALGTGAMYAVVNSTTSRWFVRKRGLVVGLTSSGGGVGAIILAPLATFLISNFDWRTAFIILGFISWILVTIVALFLKKEPAELGLHPDGLEPEPLKPAPFKENRPVQHTDFTLLQASRMSQFWLLGFIWVFLSLTLHMIFVHLVPYALELGVPPMDAAFLLSLIGLTNITGRLVVGRVSDTMDRKILGAGCALIECFSLLWLLIAHDLWMLYAFAIVFGFFWGGSSLIITALIGDIFGVRNLGSIMGVMSAGWSLGAAVGPALGGYLFDGRGNYFLAFSLGAAALFIATILLALIRKESPKFI